MHLIGNEGNGTAHLFSANDLKSNTMVIDSENNSVMFKENQITNSVQPQPLPALLLFLLTKLVVSFNAMRKKNKMLTLKMSNHKI